ncbi:MAG: T9SS C-terminal target domain-containing protein [Ignavibacteriae bacterium]|nr:MAG: T9SS C-terminal target domain-containing protein [Ignavibacteriota bacterium]
MKKYSYNHFIVFCVLLFTSTATMSAQKLVDISPLFGEAAPPGSVFVDTTGYPSLDSMPSDTVQERTYAKMFFVQAWKEHNPSKDMGGPLPRCVTGLTMNTSTVQLQAAHDSASRYYPSSIWCESLRYENTVAMWIELENVEKQGTFFGRFSQIWYAVSSWIIPVPVSVTESQTRSPRDRYAVYPNPASTSMTITSSASRNGSAPRLSIRIIDALGQHVAVTEIGDGESIDVSSLGNGAYRAVISEVDNQAMTGASVVQIIVNK